MDTVRNKFIAVTNLRSKLSKGSRDKSAKSSKSAPDLEAVVIMEKPKAGAAQVPSSFKEVTPLIEPYAYAAITHDPNTGGMLYFLIEPTLLPEDKALYKKISSFLIEELDVDVRKIPTKEDAEKILRMKVDEVVKTYKIKVEAEVLDKLMYFLTRDFILPRQNRTVNERSHDRGH